MPCLPNLPDLPDLSDLRGLPNLPDLPALPSLLSLPSLPDLLTLLAGAFARRLPIQITKSQLSPDACRSKCYLGLYVGPLVIQKCTVFHWFYNNSQRL